MQPVGVGKFSTTDPLRGKHPYLERVSSLGINTPL